MTRRLMLVGCLSALLLAPTIGCAPEKKMTQGDRVKIAKEAGQIAALTYLAIQKPGVENTKAIKQVIDQIVVNLDKYQEGGFLTALPEIKKGIAKAFPKPEQKATRLLADKLAEDLLAELDALFKRHPDWTMLGDEVAAIVAAFGSGASKGFEDYLKES